MNKAVSWAASHGRSEASIMGIYCYGSIAEGRWGVGSDLDILIEVSSSNSPFDKRSLDFTLPDCGVPVDMAVYTTAELSLFRIEGRRFIREFDRSSIVLYSSNRNKKING